MRNLVGKGGGQNNMFLFDQQSYDNLISEAPKYKLLFARLKINGSLARREIKGLVEKGLIRTVSAHSSQQIYNSSKAAKHFEEHQEWEFYAFVVIGMG
ncbi:hypothetical protein MKW98_006885 [Papaver atlanticum]|uniref:40S ribosomal protein S25 n=1 Tax=Papaver atlanticum TaxID=357466 RepID=A0AAD4XLP8_9MAGN|nr:hypothetical protein MKW98_006885 [Papaver atlanticum]